MLSEIFGDAQTTITSLAGGIGGVTANAISDRLRLAIQGPLLVLNPGLGTAGLEFVGRAIVSASVFAALRACMPQTSENVFFTFLFFYCDQGLLNNGLAVSRGIVGGAARVVNNSGPAPLTRVSGDEGCACKK